MERQTLGALAGVGAASTRGARRGLEHMHAWGRAWDGSAGGGGKGTHAHDGLCCRRAASRGLLSSAAARCLGRGGRAALSWRRRAGGGARGHPGPGSLGGLEHLGGAGLHGRGEGAARNARTTGRRPPSNAQQQQCSRASVLSLCSGRLHRVAMAPVPAGDTQRGHLCVGAAGGARGQAGGHARIRLQALWQAGVGGP